MKYKILMGFLFISTIANAKYEAENAKFCGPAINKDPKIKIMLTEQKNVLQTTLQLASKAPMTGFFRTGYCATDENDRGVHVIAAKVTDAFLQFSKANGNDLITPRLSSGFAGLKAGNTWCLCAERWKEALDAGVAPPVVLEATNIKALEFVTLKDLQSNAVK